MSWKFRIEISVSVSVAVLLASCVQPAWAYPKMVSIGEPLGSDELSRSIAAMAPSMSDEDLSRTLTARYRSHVSSADWARIFDTDHIACLVLPSEDFCSTLYFEDTETGILFLKQTKRTTWLVSIAAARHGADHQILRIQVKRNTDFPPAVDLKQGKGTYTPDNPLDMLVTMESGDSFYKDAVGRVYRKAENSMDDDSLLVLLRTSFKGKMTRDDLAGLSNNPGQCVDDQMGRLNCALLYYHDLKPDFLFSAIYRSTDLVILALSVDHDVYDINAVKAKAAVGFVKGQVTSQTRD